MPKAKENDNKEIEALNKRVIELEKEFNRKLDRIVLDYKKDVGSILDKSRIRKLNAQINSYKK
jgi:hypothetical protein